MTSRARTAARHTLNLLHITALLTAGPAAYHTTTGHWPTPNTPTTELLTGGITGVAATLAVGLILGPLVGTALAALKRTA